MSENTVLLIDLKMLVEYRAKPQGIWSLAAPWLRCYEADGQRLIAEFHPQLGTVAVYSFDREHKV